MSCNNQQTLVKDLQCLHMIAEIRLRLTWQHGVDALISNLRLTALSSFKDSAYKRARATDQCFV